MSYFRSVPAMANLGVADGLLVVFVAVDLTFTILLFGLFSASWSFRPDLIARQFSQIVYTSCPLDFIALSAVRGIVLLALRLHLSLSSKTWDLRMQCLGVATAIYSHSLVKLLCFADWPAMLLFPGVWLSVAWSILAALIFFLLCCYVNSRGLSNYTRLEETEGNLGELLCVIYIKKSLSSI